MGAQLQTSERVMPEGSRSKVPVASARSRCRYFRRRRFETVSVPARALPIGRGLLLILRAPAPSAAAGRPSQPADVIDRVVELAAVGDLHCAGTARADGDVVVQVDWPPPAGSHQPTSRRAG
jgi:hypothetical protein